MSDAELKQKAFQLTYSPSIFPASMDTAQALEMVEQEIMRRILSDNFYA